MKRSALPLVCGRYALVNFCPMPSSRHASANSPERKRHAVVGQHPLDRDAHAGEVVHGSPQERLGAELGLVRMHLCEDQAAVAVDGHEDEVPADVASTLSPVAGDAVADLVEAP